MTAIVPNLSDLPVISLIQYLYCKCTRMANELGKLSGPVLILILCETQINWILSRFYAYRCNCTNSHAFRASAPKGTQAVIVLQVHSYGNWHGADIIAIFVLILVLLLLANNSSNLNW